MQLACYGSRSPWIWQTFSRNKRLHCDKAGTLWLPSCQTPNSRDLASVIAIALPRALITVVLLAVDAIGSLRNTGWRHSREFSEPLLSQPLMWHRTSAARFPNLQLLAWEIPLRQLPNGGKILTVRIIETGHVLDEICGSKSLWNPRQETVFAALTCKGCRSGQRSKTSLILCRSIIELTSGLPVRRFTSAAICCRSRVILTNQSAA